MPVATHSSDQTVIERADESVHVTHVAQIDAIFIFHDRYAYLTV